MPITPTHNRESNRHLSIRSIRLKRKRRTKITRSIISGYKPKLNSQNRLQFINDGTGSLDGGDR